MIHPRLTIYGGGEMVALHVIKALQDQGFKVGIATDNYNPVEVERNLDMGSILEKCDHITIPAFQPVLRRFLAPQLVAYASRIRKILAVIRTDIAFSTQSILYYVYNAPNIHVVYDIADLFQFPPPKYARGPLASVWKEPYYFFLRRFIHANIGSSRLFVPLSQALERELAALGYPHSPVIFPPCDMIFKPKAKKEQVCLVSRIAPQKNIEDYMRIARDLPLQKFFLVGAHADKNPSYARRIAMIKPSNVEYVDARIRDRPEIVEESKVYLYTSSEPGIGIALGQAMGAGCIPVTPAWGGGAEMVQYTGVGYTFRSVNEATRLVQKALESEDSRDKPEHIAQMSKVFSAENFEKKIGQIVDSIGTGQCSPTNDEQTIC